MKVLIIRILISAVIFYIIGYGLVTVKNLWTKEVDLKKTLPNPFSFLYFKKETYLPEPSCQLRHTREKYQHGLKVHGIEWEEGFLLYEFTFMNKSKHADMEDVRLKFELPGSFIAHKIASQEGVEDIAISSENDYLRKVNAKTETVVDIMPYRTNMFSINIGKAHPSSFIKYNLIFANRLGSQNTPSYFTIQYSYIDENGEKKVKRIMHPIIVAETDDWNIDEKRVVTGKPLHSFSITPIKPISN